MKKLFSRFVSMALAALMMLSLGTTAFAAGRMPLTSEAQFSAWKDVPDLIVTKDRLSTSNDAVVRSNSGYLVAEYEKLQKMSVDELNAYIDNLSSGSKVTTKTMEPSAGTKSVVGRISTKLVLKVAWLAAAQVAKLAGYPCAAKAVEYSVLGLNYTEDNGIFAAKIKTASTFKTFLSLTKKSGKSYNREHREFKKSDNSDLFYALHNATVTLNKSGSKYKVNVFDIFDFDFDNEYDSLFTSLVNNWAWLCQNAGVLHKIIINVNFTA